MKKEIILVRHGKACSLDAFDKDIDRVLMERGVNDGYKVAESMLEKKVVPDLILTSPAARASQTALIFARALKTGSGIVNILDKLYHCSGDCILKQVCALPEDVNSVMVVAHNPGIIDLAYELTMGATNFLPTTGVVVIQYDANSWSEVSRSKPSKHFLIIPKEII
ncbi:MAG TPA: histidine phosphatase family protein [Bacteroidales bacterium]|nr:histidine phosphatase family protein [Bacteroidales bacterium]